MKLSSSLKKQENAHGKTLYGAVSSPCSEEASELFKAIGLFHWLISKTTGKRSDDLNLLNHK